MPRSAQNFPNVGILATQRGSRDRTESLVRSVVHTAEDPDALLPLLHHLLAPAGVVLIKASRSVGLENFATTLKDHGPA